MAFNNNLLRIIDELERRRQARNINIRLRDVSNPFDLPEETFRKYYRLSREAALYLFNEIQPFIVASRRSTKIPNVIKFITAMHFFAHGSYQKSVGKDHHCGLSQSAVSRCLNEMINIINEHCIHHHIQFPRNLQEITRVKTGFFEKFNFPGILGCVDGTHIAISPPPANHPDHPAFIFMNRKGFHSINCQIVCDSDLKILAINARYPGSVHDAAIWMVSSVTTFLQRNYRRNNDHTTWLLGDSGYPVQPFLLTPILGADADTPEGRYTRRHCSVRNSVERCIGVLKAYFRCLHKDRVLHYSPAVAAKIIYSCAVLHNIMRVRNIGDPDINIEYDNENNENEANDQPLEQGELLAEGRAIRNNLIANVFA